MRESDTYQMILEEGRKEAWEEAWQQAWEEGWREGFLQGHVRALLLVGTDRFGEPDPATFRRIESETRLEQFEEWVRHVARAESWTELPGL